MEIELTKKPKNVILIEGFPGFGLIGTIATEFLIEHLQAEQIGKITSKDINPMVAIHESKAVEPLGIFYDKKTNIAILHALIGVNGLEWQLVDAIKDLCKQLTVKEVISVEGVGAMEGNPDSVKTFYYSDKQAKWVKIGLEPLKEGVVMGVTGALMLQKDIPLSCVFAETHSKLPDSRAAAKVIEVLDNYLGLKIDYKPLIKKAEDFENKVKGLLDNSKNAVDMKREKEEDLNYLG